MLGWLRSPEAAYLVLKRLVEEVRDGWPPAGTPSGVRPPTAEATRDEQPGNAEPTPGA